MKMLDRHQLEGMGFDAPEGPCLANGRLLRYFILRSKPWLGVEEYLPMDRSGPNNPGESQVFAVNYGKHCMEPIQSIEDLQHFLYQHY